MIRLFFNVMHVDNFYGYCNLGDCVYHCVSKHFIDDVKIMGAFSVVFNGVFFIDNLSCQLTLYVCNCFIWKK